LRTLTSRIALLLLRLIEDRLWAVHDFEIRWHSEQRRARLRAHDVRKAERLLSHARIAPLAVNDGLEIGRSPHLRNNRDGPIISDLSRGNRVGRPHAVHKDAFHSLRTKVLRTPLILFTRNQMLFEEYPGGGAATVTGSASGGGNGGAFPSTTLMATAVPATPAVCAPRGGSAGIFCAVFSVKSRV
jgi:hypothetical protein